MCIRDSHEAGDGQDAVLIVHDGGADAADGHGDAVVSGALLLDDLVGAVLHLVGDATLGLLMVVVAVQLAVGRQRHAGNRGTGPRGDLGVAVLAHDVGMDVCLLYTSFPGRSSTASWL